MSIQNYCVNLYQIVCSFIVLGVVYCRLLGHFREMKALAVDRLLVLVAIAPPLCALWFWRHWLRMEIVIDNDEHLVFIWT